jgi:Fe(3+) dicitrate transport protein
MRISKPLLCFFLLPLAASAQPGDTVRVLAPVTVQAPQVQTGVSAQRGVRDFTIFEGRKNEVVNLSNLTANTATNNARQVLGRVTGLNIWESDQAGLQMGVGGRGLSPNRTASFNTRQNGYDISADALGYPESYYTPPLDAVERIEVVRGAASLQYGTQFGGTLNFVLKKGAAERPFRFTTKQTYGSWNFFGSFNSIGGTMANGKLRYYAFYQRRQGDGWRPNSRFRADNGYVALRWRMSENWSVGAEATLLEYVAQQPGGLTDAQFAQDPRQSVRARNWFRVRWHLFALTLDARLGERTALNVRTFGLAARRDALGILSRINVADIGGQRDLIEGLFENLGAEARLLRRYSVRGTQWHLLVGARAYHGTTTARQGLADDGSGPSFAFVSPDYVEGSDYRFPNDNLALFAEHIFRIGERLSITPGMRWEFIRTRAEGFYRQRVFDFAGNLVADTRVDEQLDRPRSFFLAGVGIGWRIRPHLELYANATQNYRAINFSDLRIANPNFAVDPAIRDERGFTADLGLRGQREGKWSFDVTAFYVQCRDRIGLLLRADQPPLYLDYRLRTNVGDSRNLGIECSAEINLLGRSATALDQNASLNLFANVAYVDARYGRSDDPSISGKFVEQAPPLLLRGGLLGAWKGLRGSVQWSYTAKHYTDASNAERSSSAVNGAIPAYSVGDVSLSYTFRTLTLEFSCNNVLDARYFTRRADAYPGPGIIPADGRAFYVGLLYQMAEKKPVRDQ